MGTDAMLISSTTQVTAAAHKEDRQNNQASHLQVLITESQNEASQGFDTKSALEIARIINHEDAKVATAVKKAIPEIALVIDQVAPIGARTRHLKALTPSPRSRSPASSIMKMPKLPRRSKRQSRRSLWSSTR